eukprot:TRINITY_DN21360_c0_g1_i1.p1 TRINITY_DN21360_c0_g1~~TRINITY_DN21360_c0_g1_i1.p1  ORF type:complete len:545 (+),score=96.33 TRINITY_DN21360_c0_g1_i1:137-1771(+)
MTGSRWTSSRDGTCSARSASAQHSQALTWRRRLEGYIAGESAAKTLQRLDARCDLAGARVLGSGSLGDVLLARDRDSGRNLAVKIVSLQRLRDVGAEEASLRREIRGLLSVQHPNVVRLVAALYTDASVFGAKGAPPYLCLAMEYVEGAQPLSKSIARGEPLPDLALHVLPQVAGALQEFHARGFVHRDVWAENVLIDADGRAVLVDLGCAAEFARGPDVENRLNVPYMSPQASAGERQQPGDDCWALGCLLTEMVTGRFIIDAMGGCSSPLHAMPSVLYASIERTYSCGPRVLGDIAAQLLDVRAERRLQMCDLLAKLHFAGLGAGAPSPRGEPSPRSVCSRDSSVSTAATCRDVLSARQTPRSFAVASDSPVMLRTPRDGAPAAGVVSASGAWRRSSCPTLQSPLGSQASVVCRPTSAATVPVPPPPAAVRAAFCAAAGSPPPPTRLSARALEVLGLRRNQSHDFGGSCQMSPGRGRSSARHEWPPLAAGARVNYAARSHHAEYSATVVGCSAGGAMVRLDGGSEKLVGASELWRLRPPTRP